MWRSGNVRCLLLLLVLVLVLEGQGFEDEDEDEHELPRETLAPLENSAEDIREPAC